jgi:hypothetical protein
MRRKSQPDPVDLAMAATAERQHGVISHPQLVALGLSREAIHAACAPVASTGSTKASTPSATDG